MLGNIKSFSASRSFILFLEEPYRLTPHGVASRGRRDYGYRRARVGRLWLANDLAAEYTYVIEESNEHGSAIPKEAVFATAQD
jgi:hypothetical protein